MRIFRNIGATAGILLAFAGSASAQVDDADRVLDGFLDVEVALSLSHLTKNTGAIIISCGVYKYYDESDAVGKGKLVIHGGQFDDMALGHDSGEKIIERVEFLRKQDVFGYGGTREMSETVTVTMSSVHDPSRMEEWGSGECILTIVEESWTFEPEFDDLEGTDPAECTADAPQAWFTCVRPGTATLDAYFSFNREF